MEVILKGRLMAGGLKSFLHVCGGDPISRTLKRSSFMVFSTYVEVILKLAVRALFPNGFLHVCGGDPGFANAKATGDAFSPRMWR